MDCGEASGKTRYFYTGNQVGYLNHTGIMNAVAGGIEGSGISAGIIVSKFFPNALSRDIWKYQNAHLSQELLDACFPFIEMHWIADLYVGEEVWRVSDQNVYVQDKNGVPRFYEARAKRAPSISITLGEWLSQNLEIGDLKLQLNNCDGYYNDWLPQGSKYIQWIGARVEVRVGFSEKFENYLHLFNGFVSERQGVTTSENDITIKCYDMFDKDEVAIPKQVFNEYNFPMVEEDAKGKGVPIIYGDWTTEVPDYGAVPARCINFNQTNPSHYIFKISENRLSEITEVWLHRGQQGEDQDFPPILLDDAQIVKDLERGEIRIPVGTVILRTKSVILDRAQAGVASGSGLIRSESTDLNFITLGVQVGDYVVKTNTSTEYTVTTVTNNTMNLSGGTFNEKDEYRVKTYQYKWREGDKISVKCRGKNVQIMATNRLGDMGLSSSEPQGLSISNTGTAWFADNTTKFMREISLNNEILRSISYASVHSSLNNVSGVSVQTDNSLWILDKSSSRIYRYLLDQNSLGLTFGTWEVSGLAAVLSDARGLTIDEGNLLYLADNASGNIYVINPFTPFYPTLVRSFHRSAFDSSAIEITDLSADVNNLNLCVVCRYTLKHYRVDRNNGSLLSQFNLSTITADMTYPVGVSSHYDGTLFFLDRDEMTLYNYNEDSTASDNVGFIARDLLQNTVGKKSTDFDLIWNQVCRQDLAQYRCRIHVEESTNLMTLINKMLQQFSTCIYTKFNKYSLYHVTFDNFQEDGALIREGDIKEGSFNVTKEWNQYFNSANADFKKYPFSSKTNLTDTYISPTGMMFAGKEIKKKLDMKYVYRRNDVDKLIPLFVKLSAAEPEFITFTAPFRMLFTQLCDFYRMNFYTEADPITGQKIGGRRHERVPCWTRSIEYDLETMTLKFKVWSLGTTAFGAYVPSGQYAGGAGDQIVLSNTGVPGWISPTGIITGYGADYVELEDVDGYDAEGRTADYVGKAWDSGMEVAFVNASDWSEVKVLEVDRVENKRVYFTEAHGISIQNSIKNNAGFIVGGFFLRYALYNETTLPQKQKFAHYGLPETGYPSSSSVEYDEQKSGQHDFEDTRKPYVLHPYGYIPEV